MQGTISSFYLAEIFRAIYHNRCSGELVMRQDTLEKRIYFERGQVVFASSNRPEDRIGETLTRYGKLTRDQVESFAAELKPGQHLGRALVEAGTLSERELITYATLQIIDIIYSLFNWAEGAYEFIDGENRAPEDLKLKFSTATLILEGIRRIVDFDAIRRGIGNPALPLLPTATGRSKLQAIAFSPLELTIVNMIKEPIDLLKVLVNCKERPEKVLQAIYGLLAIGLLEQGQEAAADLADRQVAAVRASGGQQPFVDPALAAVGVDGALLAEIEDLKQRIETRNAQIILGITSGNNPNEIYNAYLRLATQFHPDKYLNAPPYFKSEIDYIFAAVNESYNIIRTIPPTIGVQAPLTSVPIAPPPMSAPYSTPPGMQPVAPPALSWPPPVPIPNIGPMPSIGLQQSSHPTAWQTGGYQQAPPTYGAPPQYPQQPGYYGAPPPQAPPPNPMTQYQSGAVKRSSITRAVSDEIEYKGLSREQVVPKSQPLDVERSLAELLDYFDDKRAPMFAAEALSTLLRTRPPFHVERRRVVEAIINWARNKSSAMGWPITVVLLRVVSLIKQAEHAKLIENFDGTVFYQPFIQELAGYCSPSEADEFMRCIGNI